MGRGALHVPFAKVCKPPVANLAVTRGILICIKDPRAKLLLWPPGGKSKKALHRPQPRQGEILRTGLGLKVRKIATDSGAAVEHTAGLDKGEPERTLKPGLRIPGASPSKPQPRSVKGPVRTQRRIARPVLR